MAADAVLVGCHQVNGLKPQMQWQVALLTNLTLADVEIPTAFTTLNSRDAHYLPGVFWMAWCDSHLGDRRNAHGRSADMPDREFNASPRHTQKWQLRRACKEREDRTWLRHTIFDVNIGISNGFVRKIIAQY